MKKTYLMMAVALAALASCSDDTFIGDQGQREAMEGGVISFTSSSRNMTRAENTDAANLLNKNFVFLGTKGIDNTKVFDNYQANYVQNTSNTTESNSSGWEYVTYKNLPNGVTTNVGVPAFSLLTGENGANASAIDQTIKYWDYSTTQYDFAAYSLGKGHTYTPEGGSETTTYATASAINTNTKTYTLTGSAEELKACYISDLVTVFNNKETQGEGDEANDVAVNDYGKVVTFSFRSLATKIRLAFYETVPGYSVKDVKFYTSSSTTTTQDVENTENAPTLFTSSAVLPSGSGTMTVSFPTTGWANSPHGTTKNSDYNKAHVSFAQAENTTADSKLPFEALANFASAEYKEATGSYIGRTSNAATYAGGATGTPAVGKYYTILPNETGANLMLRIKYTLVSRDGSGEEMTVDNATAVIPAELAKWQPNYAYTYIFKIGDMTNGSTGIDKTTDKPVMGLTPITLDAVVVDSEDGVQETITTVSEPSITTYQKGKVITANDEYKVSATSPIYIIVNNGTSNVTLITTGESNAKLYTAEVEDGAAQIISEETVANAIASNTDGYDFGEKLENGIAINNTYYTYDAETGAYTPCESGSADGNTVYYKKVDYSVKDALGKKLIVKTTDLLAASTKIDAADSPTGNKITVPGAKFTPTAAATYVFEYITPAVAESAAGTYDAASAAAYNATLPGAIHAGETAYSFISYGKDEGDNYIQYGTGKAKFVSEAGGWTTVLVTNNSAESETVKFVGKKYKVNATEITTGTYYQLYEENGTATGIYVVITENTYLADEATAYNATLTGAVKDGDSGKPAVAGSPAQKHYKVIKVVE